MVVLTRDVGIAYTVPDLDATIRIYINQTDTGDSISCIEASLTNGKTVYQSGVGWSSAVISGLGVLVSAVMSTMGLSKTAIHIATNVLTLFGFMQSQALFGMLAVDMPPIVESWTQNFQWSMGIIHVGFLETLTTWYQRATGGKPSMILSNLEDTSVHVVKKRSLDLVKRSSGLVRRAGSKGTADDVSVAGIERVGFRAGIELTNIFLTGLIFFFAFVILVMICLGISRGIYTLLEKKGKIPTHRVQEIDWNLKAKGTLFRLFLVGFVQMCVLCLWEFTHRDSPAEIFLAVFMLLLTVVTVGVAAFKVIYLARQSVKIHQNPAFILYANPVCLTKWGILYTQYQATAYYFIVPSLVYLAVKAIFIACAQSAPVVQTVAMVVIEAAMLIAASVLRPWMDKKANVANIAICAVGFLNSIFLLFFSGVFNQPGLVTGVMGVVFFVVNAVFILILLIAILVSSAFAIFTKNPDTRYQPMADNRDSFIKSSHNLPMSTELDALGATARGDHKDPMYGDAFSPGNGLGGRHSLDQPSPHTPVSQVDLSVPLIPSNGQPMGSPMLSAQTMQRGQNNASPWHKGAGFDHH